MAAEHASLVIVSGARRQLTAFLPPPIGDEVDQVRWQWDPAMARQIRAHFTLCHTLSDEHMREVEAVRETRRLHVGIGDVRCWGEPSAGIFLNVDDSAGAVRALRQTLRIADLPDTPFHPHVTLTHPRTTPAVTAAKAWESLQAWRIDAEITVGSIAVIEHDGVAWRTVNEIELLGAE